MARTTPFSEVITVVRPLMKGTRKLDVFTAELIAMSMQADQDAHGERSALQLRSVALWKGDVNGSSLLLANLASEIASQRDEVTFGGNITRKRPIGKGNTNVEVTSTNSGVESGTYKSRHTKNHWLVGSTLLQLIGYENPEKLMVITRQDFKTKAFTWRTFWPACCAYEDRIASKPSVLLPSQNTSATAAKCALAALITGRDYGAWARDESTDTKKLKNNAVIEYLERQPEKLAMRIESIKKALGTSNEDEIKHHISEISQRMEPVQQSIALAMAEGQRIVGQLQQVREGLAESSALGARYEELAASYRVRIDRLDFVQQGMHLLSERPAAHSCPVCDNKLDPAMPNHVPDSTAAERDELVQRLADLNQTLRQMGDDQGAPREAVHERHLQSTRRVPRSSGLRWAPICSTRSVRARSQHSRRPRFHDSCSMRRSMARAKPSKARATAPSLTSPSCLCFATTSPAMKPATIPACWSSTHPCWASMTSSLTRS
ncbi:hypothetical protein Clow_00648 [Corynebacterium lowii]|uniref:Uncharacterized protein n=1 Tax=Corynebacterium lowii TaxID=1544413 RepID=A0A0Q0YYY6_9CORY|nr:hypothetical protein Clow_00648 [Corynebacterium lowii]